MELLSRPRHQLRAQGRRRDQSGVVFVKHERRARWRPSVSSTSVANGSVSQARAPVATQSRPDELLDFLARTAVDAEKAMLLEYVNPVQLPQSVDAFARFKRSLVSVRDNDRASFRQERNQASPKAREGTHSFKDLDQSKSVAAGIESATADIELLELSAPIESQAFVPGEDPEDWGCAAGASSEALKTLLGALNDWLSAGESSKTAPASTQTGSLEHIDSTNGSSLNSADGLNNYWSSESERSGSEPVSSSAVRAFSLDIWRNPLTSEKGLAPAAVSPRAATLLSASLQEAACQAQVRVQTLPQGRRLECHENGAVLEKDEFGRVTQARTRLGEILSIYYGQDGAAEGFVRTDAQGRLHSVGDVDSNGVTVRDNNGRLRAAGESLSIDSNGKLSICRSDGQYWSLDLLRQLMVEKRKLCNERGIWTSMTAIFAGDGFRMMTLFQELGDPSQDSERNQQNLRCADSALSKLCPDGGRFRFYGRDGSMIEFLSEQELANLLPTYVSAPGVRPIEPRWQSKPQAGTAWNSVQEFLRVEQSA